jgi:hypothetical protein
MPTKTIAVPANPGARRGKRIAASTVIDHDDDGAMSVAPIALRKPARPTAAQPAHRFHPGERLRMSNGGYSVARIGAFCKIVALLPYEGHGSLLYRVRSENEAHERIVAEADLARS